MSASELEFASAVALLYSKLMQAARKLPSNAFEMAWNFSMQKAQ